MSSQALLVKVSFEVLDHLQVLQNFIPVDEPRYISTQIVLSKVSGVANDYCKIHNTLQQ